jgi:hypothetical protein
MLYVKYFERVAPPDLGTTSAGYLLPHARLRVGASPLDFISLSSVMEPAHVVPNFDTAIMPERPFTHTIPLTDQYTQFWLNVIHFPTAL